MTSPDGRPHQVLLVGGGKMGSAFLQGWLNKSIDPQSVFVVEPDRAAAAGLAEAGVWVVSEKDVLPDNVTPDVVVLAVKPQVMADVAPVYQSYAKNAVFLSIAAGKTLAFFEDLLGEQTAIVRAMPNTPAAVGRGMTVAAPNKAVSEAQRAMCHTLLEAGGAVAWLEDEALMDAVTAVSGSGPAYVFYLTECLAAAGIKAGLTEDMAELLARTTVSGAGALMDAWEEPPSTLRENVTSPGGTTAEALKVLMAKDGLEPLMIKVVAAAKKRSEELGD